MAKKQRTTEWEAAVGKRLKEIRAGKALSQSQLAQKSGVPVRSLQNYEQGHRPLSLEAAWKLAGALGVSLDALVTDESPAKGRRAEKEK
jgi:transcriptional regulator with XRE-family HTH domain